ncbi:hypothetical protein, partial [Streptomyces sp. NPDC031705]|uniref:hypothetical protein n=1 Tax=Streptomyces sp. NPDC031705 TaxID=3155729 RepID=UPI0033F44B5C
YGERFIHRTGHGIGVTTHEPRLKRRRGWVCLRRPPAAPWPRRGVDGRSPAQRAEAREARQR